MSEHLIQQAARWFDDIETWKSFVELIPLKDQIEQAWLNAATEELRSEFRRQPREGWNFRQWGNATDTWWFLEEFGHESVGLGFGWRYHLCFGVAFGGRVNRHELKVALESVEYADIRRAFGRIDNVDSEGLALEQIGDFHFRSDRDGRLPPYELAWHAGFSKEKFVKQAIAKLEAFMSPPITDLLRSLNRELLR